MDYNRPATDVVSPASTGHTLDEYRNLLRRRRIYPATIIPLSVLGAVCIAFYLPVSYRATGTIMLQSSEIAADVVASAPHRQHDEPADHAQQEVELLRRRVMTPDKLRQLVQEVDPYPADKRSSLEAKAQRVADDTSVERVDPITLKPLDESTAFSIHYDNPQPLLAASVAQKLVDLYLTYNRRTRTEQANEAYEFLQSQAKELEASMVAQEQKLAHFKATYGNSLPDRQQHNLLQIDRVQRDLEQTQHELLMAEEKESELQLQLNNLSPSMTASMSDWRTQLAKLRSDLAAAEEKYTPEHPEIKRLKRAIDEMVSKGSASLRTNGQAPDNPDYLAVQSQLRAAQRAVATLRAAEARERRDIAAYESGLSTEPNVEREYTQLQRDYDNARLRYEDIQAKMKNAALARTLEQEERGDRFTLLQGPVAPKKPYSPNRLGIILLGMVLGVVIAFGCVTAVDAADPTVRGTRDLQEITGGSAIGAIPVLLNPSDLQGRKLRWGSALGLFAVAVAVAVALMLIRST
jgi:polysaccharide chain length determinant protein (PEP-CTERM system associated)